MLDPYLTGCIGQLEERIRELRLLIPRNLPRDYDALAQTCRQRLDSVLAVFRSIRDEPTYRIPVNQPERLRRLRRAISDLDLLETAAVAALARATPDDHKLNAFLEQIAREINYPLVTPVVTTLSQQYFYIHQDLNLLAVPLIEGRFLLHLPDLYHELAHPLLVVRDEPHVAPFQTAFLAASRDVLEYFYQERIKEDRRHGPSATAQSLELWQVCWMRAWLIEFFCDLFATLTLGPAFVWSHLHLTAMRGRDPFEVPQHAISSHPADDARMQAMLGALNQLGFTAEASVIESKWSDLLKQSLAKQEPEYRRCFPKTLVASLASHALSGVRDMQCVSVTPDNVTTGVRSTLNKAWQQFWTSPQTYVEWERAAVAALFEGKTQAQDFAFQGLAHEKEM